MKLIKFLLYMECMHCGKEFSSKQMLEYHVEKKVCRKPRKKRCEHCDRPFSSKQMLNYHVENRVCLKNICERCEEDKDDEWHRFRCLTRYELDCVACEIHGDIAARCCPEETRAKLTRLKKKIDMRFAMFDRVEGVRWEDREYWEADCPRCGCNRSDQHIWQCLYVQAEGPITIKEYVDRFNKNKESSE